MKPYFDTSHVAGVLMLIVTMGWGTMELAKASTTRQGATKIGGGGRRGVLLPTMAAATALLVPAPRPARLVTKSAPGLGSVSRVPIPRPKN